MTNREIAEIIAELMEKYSTNKANWIKQNGTDEGFNEWFTDQVKGIKRVI